jgi:hypothetical protein
VDQKVESGQAAKMCGELRKHMAETAAKLRLDIKA